MQLMIGADPELFVKDRSGLPVSAHGMVEGTKDAPFPVKDGAVQVDGTALEFNINPSTSARGFSHNVASVMRTLKSMIPEGHDFDVVESRKYDKKQWEKIPKGARELGCAPDFNAYVLTDYGYATETQRSHDTRLNSLQNSTTRTAAGHVHVGWGNDFDVGSPEHLDSCVRLTRMLDAYLGVPAAIYHHDNMRASTYGRAGIFRPKPYGMEYRVLGNWWIKKDEHRRWVFRQVKLAMKQLLAGNEFSAQQRYKIQVDFGQPEWNRIDIEYYYGQGRRADRRDAQKVSYEFYLEQAVRDIILRGAQAYVQFGSHAGAELVRHIGGELVP